MENNNNEILNNDEENENDIENQDLFEKYNTYYTINIICSFLDKKTLLKLRPLKRRFYEVIQIILDSYDKDIHLPMFKSRYDNIEELFNTYILYVVKNIKNIESEREKQKLKEKTVYNILKNVEGNILKLKPNNPPLRIFKDYYYLKEVVLSSLLNKDNENFGSIIFKEYKDNENFDSIIFKEYCNFIFCVFKLYKIIFNKEHKPKFEIIELGGNYDLKFYINKKNKRYYLNIDYEHTCLGKEILYCSELNILYGNEFNDFLLHGCDFKHLKSLKLTKISYFATNNQILENIEFNDMLINYDSFYNLFQINKNTIKKIIFNRVKLYNKYVNDMQLKNISQIFLNLKKLEYVKLNMLDFPIIIITCIFKCLFENFIKSKYFIFFSLESKEGEIKNNNDIYGNLFNKLKIEHCLIENKFKTLNNFKKEIRKGFFVKMKDLDYELFNGKNCKIISSLNILNKTKKFLIDKKFKEYIQIKKK
jgi:hypothetical protein